MLHCPKCKSKKLKVVGLKPRDVCIGKPRWRQCLKCDARFTTLEKVFVIPEKLVSIKEPKKAPAPPKKQTRYKRKPMPSLQIEPDWDAMTDDEIEAFITSN